MVYTPKLVSQNKSYLVNNVNSSSSSSYQGNEGFNSSSQWLRRRLEQSQENSFASEDVDQSSPLLMRGKSRDILTSRARSTGFQHFNILSPVYEQSTSTPTSPTTPTTPQLQGLIGEHSRTPLQSIQFQPRPEINTTTGSSIGNIQSTFQQNISRSISAVPTSQNTTPFYQSQPRAYVPITQSSVTPINTQMYTGPSGTSDPTFNVLNNRFERQQIPIYSSSNLIGRDISSVNARIVESPLVQSTPAPKPRHQQTPPRKVEKVPYLARLLMIEQELPKNEYEVEKSNSVKTLFFNFCLWIFIIFLTSTKHFRRFENYYTNVIGYLMFCIPAFYVLKVFYTNVQWARKKRQIDQLREKLVKELDQNNSYDTSSFTISPSGRSQSLSSPRPPRSTTTPLTTVTPSTVVSSTTQSAIFPSTSTSIMSPPYAGGSTTSTIIPPTSSTSSFINAWGTPSGTPFPQRIPPTTKYRQAPYVTPSRIDEKLITVGSISARLPPEPKPTDRET